MPLLLLTGLYIFYVVRTWFKKYRQWNFYSYLVIALGFYLLLGIAPYLYYSEFFYNTKIYPYLFSVINFTYFKLLAVIYIAPFVFTLIFEYYRNSQVKLHLKEIRGDIGRIFAFLIAGDGLTVLIIKTASIVFPQAMYPYGH